MPSQIFLEYHNNRERKIKEVKDLASNLKKNIKNFFEEGLGVSKQSPFYSILKNNQKQTIKDIEDYISKNKQDNFVPDSVLAFLENVYKNKVSQIPLPEELIEQCDNIRKRYELNIPPGYKDYGKKDNIFGDALIWLDIIDYAKNNNKDVIWVSDDTKEDWVKNNELRDDLVREFQLKTGRQIKHYTSEVFFKKMGDRLNLKLSKANISEISNIVKSFKIQKDIADSLKAYDKIRDSFKVYNDVANSLKIPNIEIYSELSNYVNEFNSLIPKIENQDYLCKCTEIYNTKAFDSILEMQKIIAKISENYTQLNMLANKSKKQTS